MDTGKNKLTFEGMVRLDIQPFVKIKTYDKRVETPPHYDALAEFHFSYHHGSMYSLSVKQTASLSLKCRHFVDCIRPGLARNRTAWKV